jgi:hypothetical protein
MPSTTRMAPPPPTDFSPQASLRWKGPHVKPPAMEPEQHAWKGTIHDTDEGKKRHKQRH